MSSITIRSATGTWSAETPRAFVVGREPSCDIVADDQTVSRRHAEIRPTDPTGEQWEVVDLGSSQGTWVDGRRVDRAPLTGTTTVRFGQDGSGLELTVTVTGAAPSAAHTAVVDRPAAPAGPGGPLLPPPGLDVTRVPHAAGPGPGGYGAPTGPGLLVRLRSGDRHFEVGQAVRIGRDPSLEVHTDNPAASRLHAVVEPRPDGWWLVDRSTAGTFVDGERVSTLRLTEPVTVLLGHPTAGYELELVPVVEAGVATAGIARRKRKRTLAIVGAAAAVLVLVGGGVTAAVVLGGDDGDDSERASGDTPAASGEGASAGLSQESLDRAKAATVFIATFDAEGQVISAGSGSIISEDGKILTNAHVADPGVPGMDGPADTDSLQIYTTTPDDDDAKVVLSYIAEPLVSDGYLDITVAQITGDAEGNAFEDGAIPDLPEPLPLGDSDALRTLDPITAFGYPDLSRANTDSATDLPKLTVTAGTVSAFNSSEVIGSDRAEIDADIRIGSGNSGGPSINDAGEIIGLNTRVYTENIEKDAQDQGDPMGGIFTSGSGRIVPVNLADAVLEIAEQGGDRDYVSPYLEAAPDPAEQMAAATVEAHGWALDGADAGQCTSTSTADQPQILSVAPGEVINAQFVANGLAEGTPVAIDFYVATPDPAADPELVDSLPYTLTAEDDGACLFFAFLAPENVMGVNAVFRVGDQDVVQNPLQFQ
ncbi:hypothetical protein GCM10023340_05250 [Nocardioides marinquilinus]|uniref:FHA domain-containing protein n=1 Tax=Nocardioides marinquilinus TaxID=1210400 RepID=A0ABP9P9K9_9ACTN